jgi:glycosyltransferase involved in cell wall biosynthesis
LLRTNRSPRMNLLFCAFCEVPGPTAKGTRIANLIQSSTESIDVDAITLKTDSLEHIQRLGDSRMMRVPVGGQSVEESVQTYQRALRRQLQSTNYDLVYCADILSAQIAVAFKETQGYAVWLDVAEMPTDSEEPAHLPVLPDDDPIAEMMEIQKQCFSMADRVIVSTREGARVLSSAMDPRRIRILPRAIDRSIFKPVDTVADATAQRVISLVTGQDPTWELEFALTMFKHLCARLEPEDALLKWLVVNQVEAEKIETLLGQKGLGAKIQVSFAPGPLQFSERLSESYLSVVPGGAPDASSSWALPYRALAAMACGVPVVLADGTESRNIEDEAGDMCLIVPASSPERAATAVIQILQDANRYERARNNGLRYAEENSDLKDSFAEFSKLMTEAYGRDIEIRLSEATDRGESFLGETQGKTFSFSSQSSQESLGDDESQISTTDPENRSSSLNADALMAKADKENQEPRIHTANGMAGPAQVNKKSNSGVTAHEGSLAASPHLKSLGDNILHEVTRRGHEFEKAKRVTHDQESADTQLRQKTQKDPWAPDTERESRPAFLKGSTEEKAPVDGQKEKEDPAHFEGPKKSAPRFLSTGAFPQLGDNDLKALVPSEEEKKNSGD